MEGMQGSGDHHCSDRQPREHLRPAEVYVLQISFVHCRDGAGLQLLQKFGLEMDLEWAPRLHNIPADDLTNAEFSKFDPKKRINIDFTELEFIVLDKLMEKAGEMDEEIRFEILERRER